MAKPRLVHVSEEAGIARFEPRHCGEPQLVAEPVEERGDATRLAAGWVVEEPAEDAVGKTLVVELKYGTHRERSLAGIRRVSKPGLRVYAKAQEMPRVLGGLGIAIISTSHGLLTDRQARKRNVGGEVLAWVW